MEHLTYSFAQAAQLNTRLGPQGFIAFFVLCGLLMFFAVSITALMRCRREDIPTVLGHVLNFPAVALAALLGRSEKQTMQDRRGPLCRCRRR